MHLLASPIYLAVTWSDLAEIKSLKKTTIIKKAFPFSIELSLNNDETNTKLFKIVLLYVNVFIMSYGFI